MNHPVPPVLRSLCALLAGLLTIPGGEAACTGNALPAPQYKLENFWGCATSGSPFYDLISPLPLSFFDDCEVTDANGTTLTNRVELGQAAFNAGPFADLDVEVASYGQGASGLVESWISVTVRRLDDLIAWIDVPVRYSYLAEARVDAIRDDRPTGRMTAHVSVPGAPSVTARACTLALSYAPGCDPSTSQVDSKSGSGIITIGQGEVVQALATSYGNVSSYHPSDPTQIGPNIQGAASAELRLEIDPNFAFANAFELEFSDGDCVFGGPAGQFE